MFGAAKIDCFPFEIHGEPTIERIEEGVTQARQADADVVIGFGGGSVIDFAKAIAAPWSQIPGRSWSTWK